MKLDTGWIRFRRLKKFNFRFIKDISVLDSESIANGKKIFLLKKNEEFTLLSFQNDFYFIDYKETKGYVYYVHLNGIAETEEYKAYWIKKNEEKRIIEKQREIAEQKSGRLQKLTKEFGSENAYKIINKKIWIGMTDSMAKESIGSPKNINRDTYSSGIHEQWVYERRYLYFENGVLKSWQDQK
jgi:hypothetical protein